ncbi:MAG: aconitate hydratase AcnA [Comamonadaceae bacterium]|nr:aconitate hydratase AcnA [Comamonadaceae bacterium]
MAAHSAIAQPTSVIISAAGRTWHAVDLPRFVSAAGGDISQMPFVTRILLENLLRSRLLGRPVTESEIALLLNARENVDADLPLYVSRVILPDSSGVPVLQDLAALRSALARAGGDPSAVDTRVPVDLVVDHSLQVDHWGQPDAMKLNMRREFERNAERYAFIGWAQQAFGGLRVFPPGSGIIHQVNLERIATVVATDQGWAFPDFVIGGDSHTPMVNGIGVLGWGVGGIDAEAALLGHAYTFPLPEVVGVKLTGVPGPMVWTTDIALLVTERLRQEKVANCAVEYFGPGALALSVPERATLANMSPEYGATCGFFAVDARTLDYLRMTGRSREQLELVEAYCRATGLFRQDGDPDPVFSRVIEIDLSQASASMAGPQRPQDRLALSEIAPDFQRRLAAPMQSGGFGTTEAVAPDGARLPMGAIVIAAITSCTNTSNPQVMFAAGLVARNAVARGMTVPPWVKTSLAPGSPAVVRYLEAAGLKAPLAQLGFELIGFGCTTCAGKSGPLAPDIAQEIEQRQLVTAAVLSGNRNFTGRIHKLIRANYIGAPPLVVGYALAGRIGIDLNKDPIGKDAQGQNVFWHELLPDAQELASLVARTGELAGFGQARTQQNEFVDPDWCQSAASGTLYPWDPQSQYLREPPFFSPSQDDGDAMTQLASSLTAARVLAAFGDSLTTDHISPSGEIPADIAAGQYLLNAGVAQKDFNTYVGRRGNFEVMVRGTFANVRIRNALTPDLEGGWTLHFPDGQLMSIFDAAQAYIASGIGTIVLGGKEYGTGSSRDWAAKGSALLGVKAVIAESYERIHRANLIGMGVLPLRFSDGQGWRQLGLDGSEKYAFEQIQAGVQEGSAIQVTATHANGTTTRFMVKAETRTAAERTLMSAGGLPKSVLQDLLGRTDPRL